MKKIIAWLLVVLCCLLIYSFSAETGEKSIDRSMKIAGKATELSKTEDVPDKNLVKITNQINYGLRKSVHGITYFGLTLALLYALSVSGVKGAKRYVYAALLAVIYACLDEIHQMYVPGRTGSIIDVFFDSIGIAAALILCIGWGRVSAFSKN